MRAVFVGTDSLSLMTAQLLLDREHEVIIVERDREKIQSISEDLDVGFVHGDGAKPAILKEIGPEQTDVLYCLTENDQTNIIASLVGRSLGIPRVVTRIEDPEFEHICMELGLEDTIVPARTIGRYLADMFEGRDLLELSTLLRDEAGIFGFVVRKEEQGEISELHLPKDTRVAYLYREGRFMLPSEDMQLKAGDEVVVVGHRNRIPELEKRWAPPSAAD